MNLWVRSLLHVLLGAAIAQGLLALFYVVFSPVSVLTCAVVAGAATSVYVLAEELHYYPKSVDPKVFWLWELDWHWNYSWMTSDGWQSVSLRNKGWLDIVTKLLGAWLLVWDWFIFCR